MIVVDAGSTGSRAYVYQYAQNDTDITIKELVSHKQKPGIATLANQPQTISSYLSELFSGIEVQETIPVYFDATAGMRLLSDSQQKAVYQQVTQWFKGMPHYVLIEAKTITGKQEGVYSWLAVNYLSSQQDLIGVMDMGGASVQISFPIDSKENVASDDIATVRYKGQDVTLFVHSFLGLGQTETTHQFLNEATCFPENYPLPNGSAAHGDAMQCDNHVELLINDVHHVNTLVAPIMPKSTVNNWYVLGGLYYLVKAQPFNYSETFSMASLMEKANSSICKSDWEALSSHYDGDDYLYEYCFSPSYYHALIVKGYGLDEQQPLSTLPSNVSGDWTLGVVLDAIG